MVGIYKITSPSGKIYIGQSIFIESRISKYRTGKCFNQVRLYNSIKKYGWDNHTLEIIHELPKDVSRDIVDEFEKAYLELYKACGVSLLNIREGGYSGRLNKSSCEKMSKARSGEKNGMFGKKHTDESKMKISAILKGKMAGEKNPMYGKSGELSPNYGKIGKRGEESFNYGRKHTKESIEKMKAAQLSIRRTGEDHPLYGKKFSDDHRNKIANKLKGHTGNNNKKVIQYSKDNNLITTFDSMAIAARVLRIQSSDINKCCRGVIKSCGGFIWKYKTA